MALEDVVTNFIAQVLSIPFLLSSLAIGYALLFFFFYRTTFWKDLSFGERVFFGLGIGVPLSAFVFFFILSAAVTAAFLRVGFDFNSSYSVFVGLVIVVFGMFRATNQKELNSTEGYERFRRYMKTHHMFYPYIGLVFAIILLLVLPSLDPSVSASSLGQLWGVVAVVAVLDLLVIPYFLFLPMSLLFSLPSLERSVEATNLVFEYVYYTDLLKHLPSSVLRPVDLWVERNIRRVVRPRNPRKLKLTLLIVTVFVAAYVPVLDSSTGLLTPRLVGEITQFDSQAILSSVFTNQSAYGLLVHANTQFVIAPSAWPLFSIVLPNPSNFSRGLESQFAHGTDYEHLTLVAKGPINATAVKDKNQFVTGILVRPLWQNGGGLSTISVSNYVLLNTSEVRVTPVVLVTKTTFGNGTTTESLSFSILNRLSRSIQVQHLFVSNLPGYNLSISGTCSCPGQQAITFSPTNSPPPIYAYFFIAHNANATISITIRYVGR